MTITKIIRDGIIRCQAAGWDHKDLCWVRYATKGAQLAIVKRRHGYVDRFSKFRQSSLRWTKFSASAIMLGPVFNLAGEIIPPPSKGGA
jgi:hypothetical protein